MYKAPSEEIRYVEENGPAVLHLAEGIAPPRGCIPFFFSLFFPFSSSRFTAL